MSNRKITDLRVVGIPWHVAHQAELSKLFKQYDLLWNPYRVWGETSRPIPENMKMVTHYEKGYYDLAILHIDQQCFEERISKGRLFRDVNNLIKDIPKVIINHMTPFDDRLETPEVIRKAKELIGDNTMIVNSYEAAEQWGFGWPIIHGMNPDEWWDLPKEPRAITVLSPAGMEKAYRRIFLNILSRKLKEDYDIKFYWVGVDVKNFNSFDAYRDYLGRSLLYVSATWQSPRPRARTEAMLSGCCIVSTRYQDAETFIENGVNGFLLGDKRSDNPNTIDNPESAAKLVNDLLTNRYKEAVEIGQRGKETARKLFNNIKFKEQWTRLLQTQVGIL